MPFKPKGEIAQWRIIYRLLQEAEVGATITYQTVAEALDLDPETDRHRLQAAARKAATKLLEVDTRAVEVIPDIGYRTVLAARQIPLAGQQVERAGRAMDRGNALATHVRMSELSEAEQRIVHAMQLGFAQVREWARQMNQRIEDHDDRLADVEAELRRMRQEPAPPQR